MRQRIQALGRRDFLGLLGAAAVRGADGGEKRLRGIFPIAQTPFNEGGKLDVDALAAEVRFVDRCGAHGFVWPQLASEYSTLTEAERLEGAETILAAGKGLRPALVIGVQAAEVSTAVRYARHAAKTGAGAVIALPPSNAGGEALLEYYKAIGAATELPLIMQAVGDMTVEQVVRMSKAVPTLRYVKDEAGATPLARIARLHEESDGKLGVFTGAHGVTLIDEMERGAAGSMPAASFVDLYAGAWDSWHGGKRDDALDRFAKAMLFVPEVQVYGIQALKYLLHLRGVFPSYSVRGKDARHGLDEAGKKTLKGMLTYVKPWLRA